MISTYEDIMDAALDLSPTERCRLASGLWDSVAEPVSELGGEALEALLDQREADMSQDPSLEMSHEEFLSHFAKRRA